MNPLVLYQLCNTRVGMFLLPKSKGATRVEDLRPSSLSKRVQYPSRNNRTLDPFQILHCDVWGPSPTTDLLGNRYFLVCTDNCSRFSWVFLLKAKSAVSSSIRNLCPLIKRQFGKHVKGLRTNLPKISSTTS